MTCFTYRRCFPSFRDNRYNVLEKSLQLSKTISGFTFFIERLSSSIKVNFVLIRLQSVASTNSFQIQVYRNEIGTVRSLDLKHGRCRLHHS